MPKLAALDVIKCTSTDCKNDLHCFKATTKMKNNNEGGKCRSCGIELIDWDRLHQQDLTDAGHTFEALKSEMIRHHFWHVEIDQKAVNHARRKGRQGIRDATYNVIRKSIGPANPPRDGYQTRRTGNIIYYAQHATACCCRRCVEYWHGVPYGQELDEGEITYFSELCLLYINERLPYLNEEGEYIPNLKNLRDLSAN